MRGLKILVVAQGVLLVAGVIALAIAVAHRVQRVAPSPPAAENRIVIALPSGARIAGSETTGDRLVVRLSMPGGGEELMLFNLANGARVATIELRGQSEGAP